VSIDRIRILSTGFSGATGYTNLYFNSATATNLNAVRALFDSIKGYVPTGVRYVFPGTGDTIDETDGHLLGGWSALAPADVVGTSAGSYSAPSGFVMEWRIAGVVDGHRPVGKTFIVPSGAAALATAGGVSSVATTAVNAAIVTFLASSTGFTLWHRPKFNRKVTPPTLERPGGSFPIVSGTCSQKTVVLRSRRD
jgi:hypothetical protein